MASTARCNYWWDDLVKYGISVVTEPTQEPITPADVREHSRIDTDDNDPWILNTIPAVRKLCETFLKRRFVTTVLRLTLDIMPAEFYLPQPRLISVTSLKYYDTSNVQQTVTASDYIVDTYTEPGRICLAYNASWPNSITKANGIEVIYSAGYGSREAVPANIKLAMLVAVQAWNRNREGETVLPPQSKSLLRSESWGFLP